MTGCWLGPWAVRLPDTESGLWLCWDGMAPLTSEPSWDTGAGTELEDEPGQQAVPGASRVRGQPFP